MDVDALLDIEKRTGIRNDDIDDFLARVNEVESQIKGLTDGTLRPEEVKVEGEDDAYYVPGKLTESAAASAASAQYAPSSGGQTAPAPSIRTEGGEAASKDATGPATGPGVSASKPAADHRPAAGSQRKTKPTTGASASPVANAEAEGPDERERRRQEALDRLEEVKRQREREEREEEHRRWWGKAELFYSEENEAEEHAAALGKDVDEEAKREEEEERKAARARRRAHDALDYSKWDKWLASPDDPATQAEREERAKQEEAAKDAAFEEANPDFCSQVKEDIEKRKAGEAVKLRRAQRFKDQGNDELKRGRLQEAERCYLAALRSEPFLVAALSNLALVSLRLQQWARAEDFAARALIIDKRHAKALFRRASARRRQRHYAAARRDLERLLAVEPGSSSAKRLMTEMEREREAYEEDQAVLRRAETARWATEGRQQLQAQAQVPTAGEAEVHVRATVVRGIDSLRDRVAAAFRHQDQQELEGEEEGGVVRGADDASLAGSANALCGAVREDWESRAYCRAAGLLQALCQAVGAAQSSAGDGAHSPDCVAALLLLLAALCADTKNAEAARAQGGLSAAVAVVAAAGSGRNAEPQVVAAAVAVVEECSTEPACRTLLRQTAGGVPGVIHLLRGDQADTVERCANIVRNLSVSGATALASTDVVPALAAALAGPACSGSAAAKEAVLGAMTNVTKEPALRSQLAQHMAEGGEGDGASQPRAAGVALLDTLRQGSKATREGEAHALAALLNGTAGEEGRPLTRQLLRAGAHKTCLDRLLATDERRPLLAEAAARAATVLARCVALDAAGAQQWLGPLVHLTRQGASLRWTGDRSALTADEGAAQWRVREQACRALALVLQGSPALAEAAMKAGAMDAVGPCLRRAAEKAEGSEPQPTLAAAATKVVIALSKRAPDAVAAVVAADLIAPLVTLLASSEDGPVRQNAGIALANLAKDPKAMARIRELRGMEMLVQLGSKLLPGKDQ